jgi:hypothetical protein
LNDWSNERPASLGVVFLRIPIRVRDRVPLHCVIWLKSLNFSPGLFRRRLRRNNFPARRNHFLLWRRRPETADGYQAANETAGNAGTKKRRQSNAGPKLHPGVYVRAGPSVAGLSDNLPGIGTFAYNGSPIATSAPQFVVVATK